MNSEKIANSNRVIKKVTWLGMFINILLGIVKIIIGMIAGSLALVADGVHSLSDLATDFAVLLGIRLSSKAPDKKHPYGHGRMETFSAFIIALILILVGGLMIYKAAINIAKGNTSCPSASAIVIAMISVFLKEFLYQITRKVAVKFDCSVLYANAWHHRTDALSSLAVVVGVAAAFWGFMLGDLIAAVAVGMMIIVAGATILSKCLHEIADASVDKETVDHIKEIINSVEGVAQWHNLRTRFVGREVFIDLHILVDPSLNITQAHDIAETLENSLHDDITRPVNITVHIEPDVENLRKNQ